MAAREDPTHDRESARFIALSYAGVAAAWILITDVVFGTLGHSAPSMIAVGAAKGLLFVAVTAIGLYFLVRRQLLRLAVMAARAERVERLRSLGEVAASIAHDFNNVLMVCRTYAEILGRTCKEPGAAHAVRQILSAVSRGNSLIGEILAFGQPHPPAIKSVALAPFLADLADELRPTLAPIDIHWSVEPETLTLYADPDQLRRVLMNLAMNARDAMPAGGRLSFAGRPAAPERESVEIAVSDTGTGVDPLVAGRIFEPLFTTKRSGTGLGLAIVQRIIDDHGGSVRLESSPSGTTVTVALPAFH